MHPSLEQLWQLQDLERQAAAHRADIDAVDRRRREIEAPVLEAQSTLDDLTRLIDERQAQRRAGDRDVAAAQQRLAKFRQQLMAVTNSREYEAVQHEIATVEAQLKTREDETIALLFELDELMPRAEQAGQVVSERRTAADEALAGLADETEHHRRDLVTVEGGIAALRAAVAAPALAMYDRTAKRYPRYAVAELKGELCVGCNVKIRPMLASAVRKGEQIVQCENCTRLLYPVKPPVAPTTP